MDFLAHNVLNYCLLTVWIIVCVFVYVSMVYLGKCLKTKNWNQWNNKVCDNEKWKFGQGWFRNLPKLLLSELVFSMSVTSFNLVVKKLIFCLIKFSSFRVLVLGLHQT